MQIIVTKKPYDRFLDAIGNENTRKEYESCLRLFMEQYPDTDKETVEFTIDYGSRGFGAFKEEEFKNCEFMELKERGRLGVAGVYGSDISFLKMEPGKRETIEKARGVLG
jgi:hypothetical protein